MAKKLNRTLCFILVLSIITSMFTVFGSAVSEKDSEITDKTKVLLNRTFDEGWDYTNGLYSEDKGNKFYIDNELLDDGTHNYFLRMQAESDKDGFAQVYFIDVPAMKKHTLIEFDIKLDDLCDLGSVIYARTKGGVGKGVTCSLISIKDNKLILLGDESNPIPVNNEWTNIAIDYDYSDTYGDGTNFNQSEFYFDVNIIVSKKDGTTSAFTKTYKTNNKNALYLDILRIGLPSTRNPLGRKKTSYCLDNLKIYCNETGFEEIPADDYGSRVDSDRAKNIPIINDDISSNSSMLDSSLCMKVGVDYALFKNKRRPIYEDVFGAPMILGGKVMLPLEIILDYIGYPLFIHDDKISYDISTENSVTHIVLGRKTATVDGEKIELSVAPGNIQNKSGKSYPVIAMDDFEKLFPGYFVTYDDMGLIIICKQDNVLNRENNLQEMLNIMKEFVFEYKSGNEIFSDISKKTNNFTHPFIMGNQEKFDRLHEVYTSNADDNNKELKSYIESVVNVEDLYRTFANPSTTDSDGTATYETYAGLKEENIPKNPYPDTLGYDIGGRLEESGAVANKLLSLAFAYQITRNEKYVLLMYDLALALGEWEHWGPAHFLNCADASFCFALAIDWSYNKIEELSKTNNYYSTGKLIDILYTHGTHQGYYSTIEAPGKTLFPRKQSTISNYTKMTNNWNAVCSAGMTISSIITAQNEKYRDESIALLSNTFENLCRNGLGQYAPDGSYVESTVYWSYGTNALFQMAMVLESACGSDYGLMDCWGLDKTCYFACHTESSDFNPFNYHDGVIQKQDTYSFFFVSQRLGDSTLASIRQNQLKNGKKPTRLDLLYYPDSFEQSEELPLSYYSCGIDAYTVRSSWKKGSMFAGILGGKNNASHGQVDSGSFVYHNLGKIWLCDLGRDEYNAYGYFSNDIRYRYYRMNAEGNNCLVLTSQPYSVPYGQKLNSTGKIIKYEANEYGSYAIIDNTDVYNVVNNRGANLLSYAKRGMMSTNNGKTVIIQDEVALNTIQSLYWFAHYDLSTVKKIKLSSDKRTAYLTDAENNTIRISIVSRTRDLTFEIMDCYTFVLKGNMGTVDKNFSTGKGGQPEHDRSNFMKLAIKAENTLSFNLAIAIEVVEKGNEQPCAYEWTPMSNWTPSNFENNGNGEIVNETRSFPKRSSIKSGVLSLARTREKNDVYGKTLNSYYRLLTDTEYAYLKFKDENLDGFAEELKNLKSYKEEYNNFTNSINYNLSVERRLITELFGL